MKFYIEIIASIEQDVSDDELKKACDEVGKWGIYEENEVSSVDIQRLVKDEVKEVNGFEREPTVADVAKVLMESDTLLDPHLLETDEFNITEAWTVDEPEDESRIKKTFKKPEISLDLFGLVGYY